MNDSQFLSLAWPQLIQVSFLIAVVWLLVKLFARQRPHLAYVLWLLVLVKCVTPPVMSSPTGMLSHLTIPKPAWLTLESAVEVEVERPEPKPVDLAPELPPDPLPEFQVSDANFEVDDLSRGIVVDEDELPPEFFAEEVGIEEELLAADEPPPVVEPEVPGEPPAAAVPVSARLWKIWLGSAGFVLLITFARVLVTLRRVYRNRIETPAELESLVGQLSSRLKLRRKVSILMTAARVGPAVVGFFRPLLILPQVVTEGRSAQELEPIIAHELLHVKRGDLGVGWLQVLVQSLWWFHPLVWLVNRFLSREAERCCDEAVVAELHCPPAAYARCLLNVLEQKRNLTPIPACPGVKPVELTKQRMERIMKLGQGCRKRTPWWCWLMVVLLGVVVLPGRGESDAEANQATLIFQLKEAAAAKVTTEIEKESLDAEKGSPKIVTRTYSIEDVIQRMCEDHELTEQAAQIHLELLIGNSMTSFESGIGFRANPPLLTKCIVNENTLIVRGLEERHEMVAGLLKLWEQAGLYQIKISTRYATTRLQVSAENVTGKQEPKSVLTTRLTEEDELQLINALQGEPRTNLLSAPNVTLFNGQRAVVFDEVHRPFVTGIKNEAPVIDVLPDGWKFVVTPTVAADGRIQLDYQIHLAEISDVETKELSGRDGKEPASVQVPKTRQVHLESIAKLRDGETLLVSGLNEHIKEGDDPEDFLVMITPKLEKVDLEDLSWESMAVNVSQSNQNGGTLRAITTEIGSFSFTNEDEVLPTPLSGVGVNSDSGVTGSIVFDERNFDTVPTPISEQHTTPLNTVEREITVSFVEVPLKEAIAQICEAGELKVDYDEDELAEEGVSLELPVTYSASNEQALWVLEEILQPLELELQLKEEPVDQTGEQGVQITIRPTAVLDRISVAVAYPIGDLLEQDKSLQEGPVKGVPVLNKIPHLEKLFQAQPKTKIDAAQALMSIIEKSLAWGYADKPNGTIRFHPPTEALVIHCNRTQHDLIAKLLCERRTACGIEVKPAVSQEDVQYFPAPPKKNETARLFMYPVAEDEIRTVQLLFLGPEKSHLTIEELDESPRRFEFMLPGRTDHFPGQTYRLTLSQIPGRTWDYEGIVPITARPAFHCELEIPQWSKQSRAYLAANAIPLTFTDSDLEQIFQKKPVTKVVYLPNPELSDVAVNRVETLVSIDRNRDPVAEAKRRGTVLAVLRCDGNWFLDDVRPATDVGIGVDSPHAGAEPPRPVTSMHRPPQMKDSARTFPNPVELDEIDTVQVQFVGPKRVLAARMSVMIGALDQSGALDFSMKPQEFRLPARTDLTPGKKYLVRCRDVPALKFESYLTLEIPDWNDNTRSYLEHNAIPLQLPVLEPGQNVAEDTVLTVAVLPHSDQQAVDRAETLLNSQLDPGFLEKAKRRGTILAVLRSHSGKLKSKSGVDSEAGVIGQIVHEEKPDDDQVDSELWKILVQWERTSKDYKKVSSGFRRFVYDAESQVEKRSKGTLFYALPDAWCLEIEPEKISLGEKSQKLSPQGQRYSVKSDQFGFSICDGTQVAVAQHDKVKIEELQGRDILRQPGESPFAPPVPFFIGLPAEVAGSRYQFTLLPNTNEEHVWLKVLPKRLSDRKKWTSAEVILDRKTFLPFAIKLIDAAGSTETVYRFTDFKVDNDAVGATLDITQVMKEYKPLQRNVVPRQLPNSVAADEIDTVQLRFLGPKDSLLHILLPVLNGPDTNYEIGLPGRQNLPPGKTCFLALGIKALDRKKEAVAVEVFEWTLETPEWNARSKAYLSRNSVPLQFTDEDLDQAASNNNVTKVVYLPHPKNQELAIDGVETIVSTRLDPGIDPVEEAKRRGTILVVLKSRGREVRTGGNGDEGNDVENKPKAAAPQSRTWNDLSDSGRKTETPVSAEPKPDQRPKENRFATLSYPVADLVVPIPGSEAHEKKDARSGAWGIPLNGAPISIPGPPHKAAPRQQPQPRVFGTGPGVLPPASEAVPGSRHLVQPLQPATRTPISLSGPPQLPIGTGGIAELAAASESKPNVASPLIELLTQTLKAAHGGELADGTKINFVQEQLCLVIRALEKDHDLIAELLDDLRRKQDLQVVIDCRVVQLPKEALNGARFGSITLNTKGAQDFLKDVEDQEEAQIIAAPKLTTLNGIGAQIQISGAAVGKQQVENMHYMIVPTVSEDRRTIDVKLAVNPKNTLDVLSKAKSITIPDGGLVLWEVTDELLSEPKGTGVPEVDKALRELKKKELGVRTFVLLTPRIIVQEEEEALLIGPN